MNIIVLIKQVPATTDVKIDEKTGTLKREGVEAQVNPFDMYAVEEAVRLKEKYTGKVSVLTMGPPQADKALRECLAMGCDEAVLVSDREFAGSDTWATSYTLAGAIKKLGQFDLIICGKQASDGDTAQVGPGISTHLNIPQVTYVKKVEEATDKSMRLERMLEEGYEIIQTPLPALLTVVKEINEPRIPSLKGLMRAKSAKITTLTQKDLNLDPQQIGLCGSPTQVVKIFSPAPRVGGQILSGEIPDIAKQLVDLIKGEVN